MDSVPALLWREHRLASVCILALALFTLWLALAPLHPDQRERALDIGAGKQALPAAIILTLGVHDVLLLSNSGATSQHFGPVLLAPGQHIRLPFEQAGDFPVAASAWPGGMLRVEVVAWPAPGWERISWRIGAFSNAVRDLPRVPADRATATPDSGIMRP